MEGKGFQKILIPELFAIHSFKNQKITTFSFIATDDLSSQQDTYGPVETKRSTEQTKLHEHKK